MKTIKERAKELLSSGAGEDTIFVAFELLKELVDAPESEPVAWMVKNGFICSMIYRSKKDADNYAADQQKRHDLSGSLASFCVIPLYAAPTPAEAPADVARDAERYRWLRDKCRATGEHWGGRWSLVIEGPCPNGDKSSGAIDKAIDAAIKRQGGE